MMRTTVNLDDDIYRAAKCLAEATGRSLGEAISTLARRGLRPPPVPRGEGLPVFDVPPDAAIIPAERALELMALEGLEA